MFDKIINHPDLFGIMCRSCAENDATVIFDKSLLIGNDIDSDLNDEKVLILKPDAYYHSKKQHNPPKSPDCLILIRCVESEQYCLYLIELKDVSDTQDLKLKDIEKKFKTMINEFFEEFKEIFLGKNYRNIQFYLVSTYPKNGGLLSPEEYRARIKTSALDAYGSMKSMKLFGKAVSIEPVPSPFNITAC